MDRNLRSNYVNNSGPRSLPHMSGNKRHNGGGNGNGHRLSPPMHNVQMSHNHNNNNNNGNQHDDLINYIKESWNKVIREDVKYYEDPRQLANFRPFDLDELWGRRLLQSINRNKHRS